MKARLDFVTNSSSSSYIIMDHGDSILMNLLDETGWATEVGKEAVCKDMKDNWFYDGEWDDESDEAVHDRVKSSTGRVMNIHVDNNDEFLRFALKQEIMKGSITQLRGDY